MMLWDGLDYHKTTTCNSPYSARADARQPRTVRTVPQPVMKRPTRLRTHAPRHFREKRGDSRAMS